MTFPGMDDFPGELHEDLDDARFGTPRDLDADGFVDSNDHALDYAVLPLHIRLEWKGPSGERSLDMSMVLLP